MVIVVTGAEGQADALRRVAAYCTSAGPLEVRLHSSGWFRRRNHVLLLSEPAEGCACGMLTDESDFDANRLRPESAQRLTRTLQQVDQRMSAGWTFTASWDSPNTDEVVSLAELTEIVASEVIPGDVRFVVWN